jgi:hypothetical protein
LISVSADRFRISDGVAAYAQSWWCRSTQLPTPFSRIAAQHPLNTSTLNYLLKTAVAEKRA